jgi:uncharacterized membrane protein
MTNNNKKIIKMALGTTLLLGLSQSAYSLKTAEEIKATAKEQKAAGREKCAGRILAGLNDCPTSMHACAGMADEDANIEEYIWMPTGTCAKIAGTHVLIPKKKKETVVKKKSKAKKAS